VSWLFYGVIIAIIPLVAKYVGMALRDNHPTIEEIICNGELLIICVGMLSFAIGELFTWNTNHKLIKIILSGTSLVLLSLTIFIFADISNISLESSKGKNIADVSIKNNDNSMALNSIDNNLDKSKQNYGLANQNQMIFKLSFYIYFFSLATSACCIVIPEMNL